ncbi:MAG TPA: 4Fe-4S binding protein [Terriglobia bacterium]|nr:4Fe-4S binding protein [Terriglobia bacterium]
MPDQARSIAPQSVRRIGRSLLLTVPMALFTLLLFTPALREPERPAKLAALITWAFMMMLFFQMMRTRQTYRWRRIFFVALGFLFPVGFIWDLIALRGSMSIPVERMLSGDTPFCFMVIPMTLIPAALTRTIIFPGSILPTPSNPHSIAIMVALWILATVILGKAWCSYGCFFGGLDEGFSSIPKKARLRKINPKWRLAPWAILVAIVLLAAATYEPIYCKWLCPFKAVTEFSEVRSTQTAIQFGIFNALFLGLVVVLPYLTKRRTQCAFFCPFGAFQSIFNWTSVFDIRINKEKCATGCVLCQNHCPTMAIDPSSIAGGKMLSTCMRCGACVDVCRKNAAVWHIKGTTVGIATERARLLYLYAAWVFASMFGGAIIANSLQKLIGLIV